jgi:hypothetical protein
MVGALGKVNHDLDRRICVRRLRCETLIIAHRFADAVLLRLTLVRISGAK